MIKKIDKNIYKLVIFIGVILAIVMKLDSITKLLSKVLSVFSPVILGIILAFIISILVDFLEKKVLTDKKIKIKPQIKRGLSILLALLLIILFAILVSRLIVPQLKNSIVIFSKSFPDFVNTIKKSLESNFSEFTSVSKELSKLNLDAKDIVQKLLKIITSWTGGFVWFLGSIFNIATNLVMGTIIALYIVSSKEKLKGQFDKLFKKVLPVSIIDKAYYVLDIANDTFRAFIIGQFTEAIILGTLCTVGLVVLGFPYPTMIGSVVGLTSLLPIVGAYIGGAFGFVMMLTVNPVRAAFFILFLIVLQQIEGNVIYPKVVGNSVGLPGLWVMVAIVVGGGLLGINGILFGLPLAATAYKILKNYVNK